jgi:hypothetical protein
VTRSFDKTGKQDDPEFLCQALHQRHKQVAEASPSDYRFTMGDLEITGIGDICLVCGTDHALAPYRDSKGPFIVDNLGATREELIELGATITRDQFQAKIGSVFFARHPDGTEVEYVQWKPDLVERLISH